MRMAATRSGGALRGEPAAYGGRGSYSIISWIAWAVSAPAIRPDKVEGHVDAGGYPGRRDVLPVDDHALLRRMTDNDTERAFLARRIAEASASASGSG